MMMTDILVPTLRAGLLLSLARTSAALVLATSIFAQTSCPSLTPIAREEVWQAVTGELRQRGVRQEQMLQLEEIELPVAVPAAESRTLRVSMVCWDADL
jgi:hypothetical protein